MSLFGYIFLVFLVPAMPPVFKKLFFYLAYVFSMTIASGFVPAEMTRAW
jgi:hypothetical protein